MTTRLSSVRGLLGRWRAPKLGASVDNFSGLNETSRSEILSAISAFQAYSSGNKRTSARRRKLFKLMSWRQQKLAEDVGYLKKLDSIDKLMARNNSLVTSIVDTAVEHFGIHYKHLETVKEGGSAYRATEALGHFARDWDGEVPEIDPVIGYIKQQLHAIIPEHARSKTVLVVPGSGLGRIAHELALESYGAVHAIEFSGLMYLCNKFMYLNKEPAEIFPYVHTCSNYANVDAQKRSVTVGPREQPPNLHLHLQDFRFFDIPEIANYDNVVVVSAFFIDTAENLLDYLDSINGLTTPSKKNTIEKGFWINIGPLKYGSAPQVELNDDELTQIRAKIGWVDLNKVNTLQQPLQPGDSGLYKYVTDTQSFWQGFYGLTGWCARRKENSK